MSTRTDIADPTQTACAFVTRKRRRADYPDRTAAERAARYRQERQTESEEIRGFLEDWAHLLDAGRCYEFLGDLWETDCDLSLTEKLRELRRRMKTKEKMVVFDPKPKRKRDPKPAPASLSPKAREVLRWLATWGPSTDSRLVASLVACGWNPSTPRVRRTDLTALGMVRAAGRLVNETLWEVTEEGRATLAACPLSPAAAPQARQAPSPAGAERTPATAPVRRRPALSGGGKATPGSARSDDE